MSKIDKFEELSAAEEKIISEIKNDPVPIVPQNDILAACKIASSYYAEKQSIWDKNFWKVVISCISIGTAFFWLLSAFLLGSCVMVSLMATEHGAEPMALVSALAPVPVIAFAIRELQYRDSNLVQIEKTCKYAPQKIYFARLWLGMFVNAIWVLLAGAIVFFKYENLAQLYFCSFIALFLVGAVALMVMSLSDSTLPLSLMMGAWILGAVFLMSSEEFVKAITTASIGSLAVATLFSFCLFAAASIKTTTKLYS